MLPCQGCRAPLCSAFHWSAFMLVVFLLSDLEHTTTGFYWKKRRTSYFSPFGVSGVQDARTKSIKPLGWLICLLLEKSGNRFIFPRPRRRFLTWCFLNHGKSYLNSHAAKGLPNKVRIHTPSWKESGFERRLGVAGKNNVHLPWERRQHFPVWKVYPEMRLVRDLLGQKGEACDQRSKGTLKTLNMLLKTS